MLFFMCNLGMLASFFTLLRMVAVNHLSLLFFQFFRIAVQGSILSYAVTQPSQRNQSIFESGEVKDIFSRQSNQSVLAHACKRPWLPENNGRPNIISFSFCDFSKQTMGIIHRGENVKLHTNCIFLHFVYHYIEAFKLTP